jgi:hypothetical protein
MSRRYIRIEDVGMTAQQRQTLVDALKSLGAHNNAPNPCNRNHWRVRLDGLAVIFEADWATETWTVEQVKGYLGNVFSVNPGGIGHTLTGTAYGPLATFSYGGANYLRLIVFGGTASTYTESHEAVLAYLSANRDAWESEVV